MHILQNIPKVVAYQKPGVGAPNVNEDIAGNDLLTEQNGFSVLFSNKNNETKL